MRLYDPRMDIGGCDGLPAQLAVLIPPSFCSYGLYGSCPAAGASQVTQPETSLGGGGRSLWSKRSPSSPGSTL